MPKQMYTLNNFSGGINNLQDPRDLADNQLAVAQNVMLDHNGMIRSRGSFATHGDADGQTEGSLEKGYGFKSFEIDYAVGATSVGARTDILFNASSANQHFIDAAGVDLRATFPVGSEILVSGSIGGNNGFHTVKAHGPGSSEYLIVGNTLNAEDVASSTSSSGHTISTHKLGESLFLFGDAGESSISHYLKSSDATTHEVATLFDGAVPIAPARIMYYIADNAVRISDTRMRDSSIGTNANKIQWWGFVKRTHFSGTTGENNYLGFYANDNTLAPPTEAVVGSGYLSSAGAGFNVNTTMASDDASTWVADIYQIAISFVYDDNQESLLYVPSSSNTFTVTAGQKVQVKIRAEGPYDERISGGRAYCRPNGSDESWVLLADVSLKEGVRTSLNSDFETAWTVDTAPNHYSGNVDSLSQNLDTYESINGYSSSVDSNSIGAVGEGWGCAVVCNRRAFVANVKVIPQGSDQPATFGDRIMYSMPNRFDTFPSSNYIDVVRGDNETYVQLMEFADRILAFKQKSVQIINVSSPSDTSWFLEENVKHNGLAHPHAVFRTDFGICWVNSNGCYLYDGSRIRNLIEGKILENGTTVEVKSLNAGSPSWENFITDDSVIGYDRIRKQLIVMRDSSGEYDGGSNSGDGYIYDFKFKSWVFATDLLADSTSTLKYQYSNFDIDYNGDLCILEHSPATASALNDGDGINTTDTAVVVDDGSIYDAGDIAHIGSEQIKVLSISTHTLTVKRGWNGTTAGSHSDDAVLRMHKFYVKKYSGITLYNGATGSFLVKTKDIDFAKPGILKKIYAVYVTYKSDSAQTAPISYEIDGTTNSYTNLTGNFVATSNQWDILKAYPSTPFTCQSLQLKITNPTNTTGTSSGIQINDITIEYRLLHKRVS